MLIALNKTCGVLCQFTDTAGRPTLASLIDIPNVYPAGRLDTDSEGLVLLTDDGRLQRQITDPRQRWSKEYWVQVEREPREASLDRLRRGVVLNDGLTRPAEATRIDPPDVWDREPPIRVRHQRADGLDQAGHPRGPQPPGATDDRGSGASDAPPDPGGHRPV